jgi:hypothetical protein
MNSPVQRGRWTVTIGAVVLVLACFLQWWRLGGGPGELPATTGIGLADGAGFAVFLAGVAILLLIALPYAIDGPVAIDQPLSFVVLFAFGLIAYCLRTFTMFGSGLLLYTGQTPPIQPLRGPGYWIAALALVILARGVFELWEARRRF